MYVAYRCKRCKVVFVIPTEYIRVMENQGRYIACPFGHKVIEKEKKYDSLRECMDHGAWKRKKGSMKQIK